MRASRLAAPAALLLAMAGCAGPPPEAYWGGGPARSGAAVGVGANAAGEACTQQAAGQGVDIFCGTWQQPAGHVQRGGAAGPDALAGLATTSPWRAGLETRFVCAAPSATTILGTVPAAVLSCTRKVGGWPQVALVASVNGTAYYADGILPVLPVLERSIGVLSGRAAATAAAAQPGGGADALFAQRLAAQAFRAGDVGQYEQLVLAGTRANLAENYAASEQAFRAALAVQRKALGADNPNAATALTYLALQVSDQGRFPEADALLADAQSLAPRAADQAAVARVLNYRALHLVNQGRFAEALPLLQRAEAAYAALLPPDALRLRPPRIAPALLARSGSGTGADPMGSSGGSGLMLDPTAQAALIGVIETRRYQAIAYRELGRKPEAEAAIAAARALADSNDLRQPILTARLRRTEAATEGALGRSDAAIGGYVVSAADFSAALPGTRPIAQTELLRAAELNRDGRGDAALEACRRAARLLRALKSGTAPELLEPCLDVFAAAADRAPAAGKQAILAEMFEAAQLAQGGTTTQQIALAAARLGETARDPRVGEAIRRRQDADQTLSDLYRQREALAQRRAGNAPPDATPLPAPADLDRRIAEAERDLGDADAALQAASPNYGQLVQQVAPAADVLGALAPGEAFASIVLAGNGPWTFLLRDGAISVARGSADAATMAALVKRVRAGIEPTARGLPRFDTDAASRIYAETLGRQAARLDGASSLVVAPTGPLLSIPFALLLTGPADPGRLADAPWLVRRTAIAHVPAAANFVALRRIAGGSRATQPWFGLGDFRPATLAQSEKTFAGPGCVQSARLFASLPPLPFAARELDASRALLNGAPQDSLIGPAYTAPAVLATNLSNYRVLHFASHALLPEELPCEAEPTIITSTPRGAPDARGALLTASAVTGLKLDADLVIVSACNSGGPGGTGGESLSGLARAFFYAGARAMMVTHWSINDQAAAFLVADTLNRLRKGEGGGAAGALRLAQLGMIDDAGKGMAADIAHPFYWAPFALIGEGRGRVVTAEAARPGAL